MLKLLYKNMSISMSLTLARFVLMPILFGALMAHHWSLALCVFVIAAITDLFDGAFARLFDEQSTLGAYLDPLADKLLIMSCLIAFSCNGLPEYLVPKWLLGVIFAKEMVLILGAFFLRMMDRDDLIRAAFLGKMAMLVQTGALFLLLLSLFAGKVPVYGVGFTHALIVILVMMSLAYYAYLACKGTRLWYRIKRVFLSISSS